MKIRLVFRLLTLYCLVCYLLSFPLGFENIRSITFGEWSFSRYHNAKFEGIKHYQLATLDLPKLTHLKFCKSAFNGYSRYEENKRYAVFKSSSLLNTNTGIDLPSLQVFECKGDNFVILTSITVIGSLLFLSGIRYSFLC